MNRLTRRLTLYLAIILLIVVLAVQYNVFSSRNYINSKVENQLSMSSEIMHQEVENWVRQTERVVSDLSRSVSYFNWDHDQLNDYLLEMVESHPEFTVFYYADISGLFIISNDWQPPSHWDMTTRPWYVTTINSDELTITKPYLDAMTGETIVTFSKAVSNQNGETVGVVAGDISLLMMQKMFDDYAAISSSEYILFDESVGKALAILAQGVDHVSVDVLVGWHKEFNDPHGMVASSHKVDYKNESGYFHQHPIAGTSWYMINYSPLSAFASMIKTNEWLNYLAYGLTVLVLALFYNFHKKFIIKPLLSLGDKISRINVKNNPGYRLELDNEDLFKPILKAINKILRQVERNMVALEEDKEEMYAMNEELEATLQQITAADQEVKRQKLNFEALFSNNQNAVAMVNAEHLVTNVNKAFTDLFGYGLDEIAGKNLDDIVAPSEDNNYARAYTEGLLQGQVIKTEGVRYTKDLKPIEVRIQGVPITREGYMIGGYGIYTDISEVKRQERERYFASTHDDLTGLFNRTYFNERLIEYGQLGVYPISIIIIDVNGLKMINDGFGPSAGDQLLKDIASALQSMAEDNQLVARFGGDEFAILTRHMSSDETERLAKRITGLSGAMSVFDTEISLSVGWSIRENAEDDVTTLLRVAEDDLYKHKVMESSSVKGRTVYTMINTLHESNKREEQHSRRVSSLCEQFGRVLALSDREMNALKSMSLLHDIGKVAIDDKILNKPGALTEEEYAEMKRHPEIGYRILSSVPELNEIAEYVLAHHEKWDGSGYPHGLKNEEIPFLARVITIVDAYDAMTSKRPYRDAQGEDWAIEELRMNAGSQFDPELIPIFIDVMTS